jgi:plastocyanin
MSLRVVVAGLALALGLSACSKKKEDSAAPKATPTAAPVETAAGGATATAPAGARKVMVNVVKEGYEPDRIPGKPGEKLTLVFTRKVDGHCYEQVKLDKKVIELPKNEPVEVAVTVPQEGEITFVCGMEMLSGVIVAEKG